MVWDVEGCSPVVPPLERLVGAAGRKPLTFVCTTTTLVHNMVTKKKSSQLESSPAARLPLIRLHDV